MRKAFLWRLDVELGSDKLGGIRVSQPRMGTAKTERERLATATRGHKLFKDKLDELMKNFFELVEGRQRLRLSVEDARAEPRAVLPWRGR